MSSASKISILSTSPLIVTGLIIVLALLICGAWLVWSESAQEIKYSGEKYQASKIRKQHLRQLELEFPAVVEMFALLVSAGISPSQAFLTVSEKSEGEMHKVLATLVQSLLDGQSLVSALDEMNETLPSQLMRRFNDSIIIALERGTPLSEVLTRQVEEVRAAQRTRLIEKAGKAEVTLMIPVVFLILPVSVLFALWPSYFSLGQSVGL